MYHSLSKLLYEMQATAAKKLGILENALEENFLDPTSMTDYLQNAFQMPSEPALVSNLNQVTDHHSSPQEHPIW